VDNGETHFWGLGAIAVIAGLGQLLASKERLTPRIVVGRILSSFALGAVSILIMPYVPVIPHTDPYMVQLGIASAIASLGTSTIEIIIQRALSR
jgi:hypothetical protein